MVDEDGDQATALMLWDRAADLGNPDAMFNLGGQASREGDWASARAWWTQAAEMGHLRSMHNLAVSFTGRATGRAPVSGSCGLLNAATPMP